uniref:pleckstrin homology domain-containing family A member 5 isoform X18 n=1 Tax=Jaculus jaculus TaxID=51337 RepID=UPI001E1B5E25|nr:pleckstrin homology domain-containing family A member 5 isoform X18 [Jaculus jaculus]
MAADLNLDWVCSLPRSWTYGITRGGRVFFINEEAKSTTWLHPVTGEAVVTGHRRHSTDLPTGWEEAYTFEGARYYIKSWLSYLKIQARNFVFIHLVIPSINTGVKHGSSHL